MNYRVPDWNMENDFLPVANQKKSMGPDHELVELLWRNGQVVLHSQTNRKQGPVNGSRQVQKPDQPLLKGGSFGFPSNLIQEDETESWIQYPLEESMEKEFCSEFLYELPSSDPIEIDKHMKQFKEDNDLKLNSSEEAIFRAKNSLASSHKPLSKQLRIIEGEIGETSVMTIGSSHCGSNQVPNEVDLGRFSSNVFGTIGISAGPLMEDSKNVVSHSERRQTDMVEMTVTSSSGGSGASIGRTGKQSISTHNHKRKGREVEDFECQSEDPEFESAQTNKSAQRSRKNRAAEVHNLSERKRRDRINEKMRALRELIPHCNKTDKASMLDEAIEYLKSLQLQVQLMWMGSGMAPMMFPSVQHYMTGMGPPPLPSIHNLMQLQRMPILDQGISASPTPGMCQTQLLNPVNFQHQMPNPNFAEQYAHYVGFRPMQPAPQPMNMFGYASQTIQQNHKTTSPSTTGGPLNGGAPNVATPTGKMG